MRKFFSGLILGMLMPPSIFLGLAVTGRLSIAAKSPPPPAWEKTLAQYVVQKSIARQAPVLKNPIEASDENLLSGMKIFHDACDGCHGIADKKSVWGTTDFYPRVPQFGFEAPHLPDWQIYWVAKNGIRYTGMGGYDPEMPDTEAWKVALFLSRLDSLPPRVAAEWHKKAN